MENSEEHDEHGHSGCACHADHDRNYADVDLLSPLKIREIELKSRIVLSPMCQYSCEDGFVNDWHLVHLGSRAMGGASLVFVEATAVTPEGRISPYDVGLWKNSQIEGLERITRFVSEMGAVPGIQLAHAGRKGSCDAPWRGGASLTSEKGGWEVVGPSAIAFDELVPKSLTMSEIQGIVQSFKDAAIRAVKAGFKVIEIHSAHGYLLHQFLSPLSNHRQDEYGNSLENRMRLTCEIAQTIREVIPATFPLFVRISATDWVEGGWDLEQSIILSEHLKQMGVDLIDVSSGGLVKHARIPIGKNYQVPFADAIRRDAEIKTGAVGLITEIEQANEIISSGKADLVFIGREFLREPYWGIKAQQSMGQAPGWPTPYGYAVKKRA